MLSSDITDKLLDDDSFTHPGTAISAHLATFGKGGNQVDDLEAGFQHLGSGFLLFQGRWWSMDWPVFLGFNRPEVVQGLSQNIEETSQGSFAYGHR